MVPAPPDSVAVPAAMTERDQWVCWRQQTRNDKSTKVPVDPSTGTFASTDDPDSWTDFATAREFVVSGSAAGIGFVFTDDDPVVGVDLDDCRVAETGTGADWATAIIDHLESYTEVSPSGTGYHVLVRGSVPGDRTRNGDVEIYESNRFFTVTGDHVEGTPTSIVDRQDALTAVYRTHILDEADGGSDEPAAGSSPETVSSDDQSTPGTDDDTLTDQELLEKARSAANGDKFDRLWRGQTSGYPSQSEADMALCSLLAFWTGRDANRIDLLFRDSGLMREKWDEVHFADGSTYGERTIERAIDGTDEVYEPRGEDGGVEADGTGGVTGGSSEATAGVTESGTGSSSGDDQPRQTQSRRALATPEEHLETIEELTAEVERLEAKVADLQAELAAERGREGDESQGAQTGTDSANGTLREAIGAWLSR